MKISIVIPYFNRRQLLLNVLRSISHYKANHDIEVIIVDDGSETKIGYCKCLFDMDISIITLDPHPNWRGASIAYNTGFKAAKGDVILINSSECVHAGDILGCVEELEPDSYMSFSSYRGLPEINEIIDNVGWNNPVDLSYIPKQFGEYWHSHTKHSLTYIPYCAAIYKENMDKLCGYDERFIGGVGYDDYDFTDRVKNLGLELELIDSPFVIHQWHIPVAYCNTRNLDFLLRIRESDPMRIKARHNKIYNV